MSERTFTAEPPAPEPAVTALRETFPHLPADYFEFLLRSNGVEGFIGISPGYCVLWPAEDVAKITRDYELHIYLPGYVCVGGSSGGDLFVFSATGAPEGLFVVPAIGMAPQELELVAPSISALSSEFGRQWVHAQPTLQADGPASGGSAA